MKDMLIKFNKDHIFVQSLLISMMLIGCVISGGSTILCIVGPLATAHFVYLFWSLPLATLLFALFLTLVKLLVR